MPYILSHTSFAYTLGERLGCFTTESERTLYLLGCLGPDLYFFDQLPPTPFHPNQKQHGNRLHEAPCDTIARALLTRADELLKPYVYGFLTHIALDSTLHPYICALHSGLDHTRFEGDIDAIFYERYHKLIPFGEVFRMPEQIDALDALVTDASREVLGTAVRGAFARSIRKMLRLFPLMYDPKGKRFRFVAAIERPLHKEGALSGFLLAAPRSYFEDCMNDRHAVWYAQTFPTVPRTESVDELFASAAAFAEKLLCAAMHDDVETVCSLCANRTMDAGPLP